MPHLVTMFPSAAVSAARLFASQPARARTYLIDYQANQLW